jgi:hypothetical protein
MAYDDVEEMATPVLIGSPFRRTTLNAPEGVAVEGPGGGRRATRRR